VSSRNCSGRPASRRIELAPGYDTAALVDEYLPPSDAADVLDHARWPANLERGAVSVANPEVQRARPGAAIGRTGAQFMNRRYISDGCGDPRSGRPATVAAADQVQLDGPPRWPTR